MENENKVVELKEFYSELRKIEKTQSEINNTLIQYLTKFEVTSSNYDNRINEIRADVVKLEIMINEKTQLNSKEIKALNVFMYKTIGAYTALLTALTVVMKLGII